MLGGTLAKTENLVRLVLLLLDLLSGALSLLGQAVSSQTVSGLVFLGGINAVVDKSEARGLSTTEVGSEAENEDSVDLADLQKL